MENVVFILELFIVIIVGVSFLIGMLVVGLSLLLVCMIVILLCYVMYVVDVIFCYDLISKIEYVVCDEIGYLMQVLGCMNDSLCKIMGGVGDSIGMIQVVVCEIVIGNFDLFFCIELQVGLLEEMVIVME